MQRRYRSVGGYDFGILGERMKVGGTEAREVGRVQILECFETIPGCLDFYFRLGGVLTLFFFLRENDKIIFVLKIIP